MKDKLAGISGIMLLFLVLSGPVHAQFMWGLQEVSIAVTNTQYGMPFVQFTPIHPGIVGTSYPAGHFKGTFKV